MDKTLKKKGSSAVIAALVLACFFGSTYRASAEFSSDPINNHIYHKFQSGYAVYPRLWQEVNTQINYRQGTGMIMRVSGGNTSVSTLALPIASDTAQPLKVTVFQHNLYGDFGGGFGSTNYFQGYFNDWGNGQAYYGGTIIATMTAYTTMKDTNADMSNMANWVYFAQANHEPLVLGGGNTYMFVVSAENAVVTNEDFADKRVYGMVWGVSNDIIGTISDINTPVTVQSEIMLSAQITNPTGFGIADTVHSVNGLVKSKVFFQYENPEINQADLGDLYVSMSPDYALFSSYQDVQTGGGGTGTSTGTSTLPTYTEVECGVTAIVGCIQNAFWWAVTPSADSFVPFTDLLARLRTKPPMGYFTSTIDAFTFSSTTASSTILVLVQPTNPLMQYVFNPLRTTLSIILYIFAAVWLFRRVKDIII